MTVYETQLLNTLSSIDRTLKRIAIAMEADQSDNSALVFTPNGIAAVPVSQWENYDGDY